MNPQLKPQSELEAISNEWQPYFISDVFPKYPAFQKLVATNAIKRVFPIKLEQTETVKGGGWLVEVEKSKQSPHVFSYFLVTPSVQIELIHSSSSYAQDLDAACTLNKYLTTGNEAGLGRKLQDKMG